MLRTCILAIVAQRAAANGRHDASGHVIEGLAKEELAVTDSGKLGDRAPSYDFWSTGDRTNKPPYVPPVDRKYNTKGGPVEGKINIHLVPHSHDDTGWQVTIDQYFSREVYWIIDTITEQLAQNLNRKFIYVETAFFARWWDQASDFKRTRAKRLVKNKQLEFINGGWCMHDEASPLWTTMVDQTTRGHQWLFKHFGAEANPKGTWQIDPFGHSNTQAWLLGAEAGMTSLFWGRMDYQDREMRFRRKQSTVPPTGGFEWVWRGSKSLGSSADVFAGDLYGTGQGGYSTWLNFDDETQQVNDDPFLHDYNIDQWVDKFVQDAREQAQHTLTLHQLWACGTDFQYQNADRWYRNLDKLIHYINQNGSVNAFYSTPTLYTDSKHRNRSVTYELRTDDVMPLADNYHNYWSGYFTSRPALKRQVRVATSYLESARLLEVATNTSKSDVNRPSYKKEPVVGTSWTDALEGTVGVATHHDGMSGTERQDVTDDYAQRITESALEAEAGVAVAFSKLLGVSRNVFAHCNCNRGPLSCLNASACAATHDGFSVAAFSPLGQGVTHTLRVPVGSSGPWRCKDAFGNLLPSQVSALDARTRELPRLYLNAFNMTALDYKAADALLTNEAKAMLAVSLPLRATSAAMATCGPVPSSSKRATGFRRASDVKVMQDGNLLLVDNGLLRLTFYTQEKALKSVENLVSQTKTSLKLTWGWYNSSVGGCTAYPDSIPLSLREPACSDQASGAYIFRPNSSELHGFDPAFVSELTVEMGPVYAEVRLRSSPFTSHTIRLGKDAAHVEVEWTAGPIPVDTPWFPSVVPGLPNNWGKEVVLRYDTDVDSNDVFYTDSNGRETVKRVRDKRGPSYPKSYKISEPVAGNYYPVNALATISDNNVEFAVVVDTSLGGASLASGSLEFMVHRRLQADDNRGVQEPLNETMCGCNDINASPGSMGAHGHEGDGGCACQGLTVRGRHLLVFDEVQKARALRRRLAEEIQQPPALAFAPLGTPFQRPSQTILAEPLPPNVKLVTLTSNYADAHDGQWLLRLAHIYEAGETTLDDLAQPVTIDLSRYFRAPGLVITSAVETTLTANAPPADRLAWKTAPVSVEADEDVSFTQRTEFAYPSLTLRPMEVRTFLARFRRSV